MKQFALPLIIITALAFSSCKEKKETRTIITKIETLKVSDETKAVGDEDVTKSFEWGDAVYEATISRKADKELPVAKDAIGNKYYDNRIQLLISGPSSTVFEHTYQKTDFNSYIDTNYIKPSRSVLHSITFSAVEEGKAVFVATIGSPDSMDDEFMLVKMQVSKQGEVSMSRMEDNY